jgi:cell division protein FtsB
MEQDELAQGMAQDPENQVVDESDEVSNSDVLISSENEEEFDLGVLEPPIPIDDQILTEPSKLRLFLRRLLLWVVAILVIFTLGVGATWLARVIPQQKEIDNLEQEMENLLNAAELSASEIEDLLPLIDESASLQSDLSEAELQVKVLSTQADVASAQLALLAEDFVTAKASLAGTDTRLEALISNLESEDRNTVQGMLTRLELVLEELGEDSFAAIRDLEVLSSNLAALERSLFGN